MRIFESPDALRAAAGEHLGHSEWQEIDQARVNAFADATGDHQWIHVDPERARSGPFGTTIAHGFLTLSLVPMLVAQIYRVDGIRMAVNYGLNKVRDDVADGLQVTNVGTVEREGGDKPCCVAETVSRFYL
jgi:acyl dehydratase